jgi:signal transduction histidine kinase
MEFFIIIGIPLALLLLGGLFLIVSQTTGFLQFISYQERQRISDKIISDHIRQIALAQTYIGQRSRQLEILSKQLALSNEELYRLNEMKSKFLSMVVHDVRTPLASIKGFSELMNKKVSDEKSKEYLKNIVLASEQLGRLVSDLTDLAMIEAGKLKMEKTEFNFSEIPMSIIAAIKVNAQKKGVELIDAPPPDVVIYGDKFRLSQVLMNLLNNAIKFTPPGKKVELLYKKEGRYITTCVKDSGIGIHPSETKKIFEKFYQAKYQKDEKLRKQGWGLGLAIAEEIIHAHKGEIWAESKGLGFGSSFFFKLKTE